MDVFEEIHAQQKLDEHIDGFFRDLEEMWGTKGAIYVDPFDIPPAPPSSPISHNPNPNTTTTTTTTTNPTLTLPQFPTSSPRYLPPTPNSYARQIWDACKFRVGHPGERESTLERGLAKWANRNHLMHLDKDGEPAVTWSVQGNSTQITGRWSAFRLWFFCACTKVGSNHTV